MQLIERNFQRRYVHDHSRFFRALNIRPADPSRDIYKSIAHELANFLRVLSRREAKTDEHFSQWNDQFNVRSYVYILRHRKLNISLKAFRDATSDLSATKHSLTVFNERFVDDLSGLLQVSCITKIRQLNAEFYGLDGEYNVQWPSFPSIGGNP